MKTLTLSFNPRHYQGCRNTVTNQAAGDQCSEALQEHGKKGLRNVWMGGEKTPPRRFFEGHGDIFLACINVERKQQHRNAQNVIQVKIVRIIDSPSICYSLLPAKFSSLSAGK